jgi:anti-sigma factor RsiW
MTCGAARRLFDRDLDGRLSPPERSGLLSHLAGCPGCRAERERWEALATALRASGPTQVPAGLAQRSWNAAIRGAEAAPAPSLAAWFVAAARPAAAAGAAAALLAWLLAAGVAQPGRAELTAPDPLEVAMQLWVPEVADAP